MLQLEAALDDFAHRQLCIAGSGGPHLLDSVYRPAPADGVCNQLAVAHDKAPLRLLCLRGLGKRVRKDLARPMRDEAYFASDWGGRNRALRPGGSV